MGRSHRRVQTRGSYARWFQAALISTAAFIVSFFALDSSLAAGRTSELPAGGALTFLLAVASLALWSTALRAKSRALKARRRTAISASAMPPAHRPNSPHRGSVRELRAA